MDKNSLKMIVLSLLSTPMIIFRNSPKMMFALGVVIELITTKWDEAWDTYSKKAAAKKLMKAATAAKDDPADHLIAHLQNAGGLAE